MNLSALKWIEHEKDLIIGLDYAVVQYGNGTGTGCTDSGR